jgi:glucosamine--fructose-6-phosphate aminotransferase (isomerizing)
VHAEGYPAGEMKHGPIAMIEPQLATVVVAPADGVADKVRSNIEQVRARGGPVICVGNDAKSLDLADQAIEVGDIGPWLSPILNVVPLQLFSYYVALARGCDIDKPRNLAKSVTVE